MYKIFSIIEDNNYKYVKFESENIKEAKNYIKEKLKELSLSKFSLLDRNKKGFSHYIKEGDFEIFTNSNFIYYSTPDDWEFIWIEGNSVNGFTEGIQTKRIEKDFLKNKKEINLNKLAIERKIPVFYHNNWRDEYYTDIFSNENNISEKLNSTLMYDIKADLHYIELTLDKYSKGFKTSLYISRDIIDSISLELFEVQDWTGVRFVLKLNNKIVYGSGHGFEIADAIQLLQQWKLKTNKNLIKTLISELENKNMIENPQFYEYKERIETLNNLIQSK